MSVSSAMGAASVSAMLGALVFSAVTSVTAVRPIHLTLADLRYVEIDGLGAFRQQLVPSGAAAVNAIWHVQITRPARDGQLSRVLCEGPPMSRTGTYSGEVQVWGLDDWVGHVPGSSLSDCPDVLRPGDIAQPTWVYTDHEGNNVTLAPPGGAYIVPEIAPKG